MHLWTLNRRAAWISCNHYRNPEGTPIRGEYDQFRRNSSLEEQIQEGQEKKYKKKDFNHSHNLTMDGDDEDEDDDDDEF